MRIALYALAVLVATVVSTLTIAARRWNRESDRVVEDMMRFAGERRAALPLSTEVRELPASVRRYLLTVMEEEAAPVHVARIEHSGDFLLRAPNNWRPFHSVGYFTIHPAAFVWDARIAMLPGIDVRVRDALVAGRGAMLGRAAGLITVVNVRDTPEITSGALHRYLAEAVWVPSALLPSAGVRWSAIDDTTAKATLGVGQTTVSLDFHFGKNGLVERVFTPGRMRDVGGRGVPTPWEGRFQRYERHGMFLIPVEGEVAWLLPEGRQIYWRGRVERAAYQSITR